MLNKENTSPWNRINMVTRTNTGAEADFSVSGQGHYLLICYTSHILPQFYSTDVPIHF